MQSPEPQITDNSFMQFAAILVATLATETLQTLTWTLTGGCHILSAPCSRAQLQLVSLHRQVQHTLTNTGMESSVQLSLFRKSATTGSLESLLPLQNTLGPAFKT